MNDNITIKPTDLNFVARHLVAFHVNHLAAHRAYVCAHVNTIRINGGPTAHRAVTEPAYKIARNALHRAIEDNDADPCDVKDSTEVAEQILWAESKARYAGKTWDANAAVDAWLAS